MFNKSIKTILKYKKNGEVDKKDLKKYLHKCWR